MTDTSSEAKGSMIDTFPLAVYSYYSINFQKWKLTSATLETLGPLVVPSLRSGRYCLGPPGF